jgi:hypothetical protein
MREYWYCPVCNKAGEFNRGELSRRGEIVNVGNCQFTARCTGRMKRDTNGFNGVRDDDLKLITTRSPDKTIWKLTIPDYHQSHKYTFTEGQFFGPKFGKVRFADLTVEVFLNFIVAATEEERVKVAETKTKNFTITHNAEQGIVELQLTGVPELDPAHQPVGDDDLKGRGTVVIAVNGDREIQQKRTISHIDATTTDERPLTVAGRAISIAVSTTSPAPSTISVQFGYRPKQSTSITPVVETVVLIKTTDLVSSVLPIDRYAVEQISMIHTTTAQYSVYCGTLPAILLERGTIITSVSITGQPGDSFVILPLQGIFKIEIVDDIDRVYGVELSNIDSNVVSDGNVLVGISSPVSRSSAQRRKLVTRIDTPAYPVEMLFT